MGTSERGADISQRETSVKRNGVLRNLIESMIGVRRARVLYDDLRKKAGTHDFVDLLLREKNINVSVSRHETIRIPKEGACIVVANHPLGAMDGIALLAEMKRLRPDVRIVANEFLNEVQELREYIIPVNVLDADAAAQNTSSMRKMLHHVKSGGMLIVFPAGEVSSLHMAPFGVRDRKWSEHVAVLARLSKATIVPAYIKASNSPLFHLLGVVHPRMRTLMLVREMLRYGNTTMRMLFATPIRMDAKTEALGASQLRDMIRFRSELLRYKQDEPMVRSLAQLASGDDIIEEVPAHELKREIAGLSQNAVLVETDEYKVVVAKYHDIPGVMQEIGRLREITFRLAGEGSGKSADIDVYDTMYDHIIVWQKDASRVVGAYRVGRVDEQLRRYGRNGLYTTTLFTIDDATLERLRYALELGRSFVRPEFQRDPSALYLLLKGIGAYRNRYPHYRYLIGAVSISDAYTEVSKRLMINSLYMHHFDFAMASGIKARQPVESQLMHNWDGLLNPRTLVPAQEIDGLIRDMEPEGKGIPVLLRHYLALGAKVAGLHRDTLFGSCIDAFIILDLEHANESLLRRYLGSGKTEDGDESRQQRSNQTAVTAL